MGFVDVARVKPRLILSAQLQLPSETIVRLGRALEWQYLDRIDRKALPSRQVAERHEATQPLAQVQAFTAALVATLEEWAGVRPV